MKIGQLCFYLRLASSACVGWAAGEKAGPASQERMHTAGGRRQTDRQTWAVEHSALQVGRNQSTRMQSFCKHTCRTEDTILNGASVAVASYCYPYSSIEVNSHFMTLARRRSAAWRGHRESLWSMFSFIRRVDSISPSSGVWILTHP